MWSFFQLYSLCSKAIVDAASQSRMTIASILTWLCNFMDVDHYIEFKQEVCSIKKTIRDNGGWVRTQTSIATRSSSIELKVYQKGKKMYPSWKYKPRVIFVKQLLRMTQLWVKWKQLFCTRPVNKVNRQQFNRKFWFISTFYIFLSNIYILNNFSWNPS